MLLHIIGVRLFTSCYSSRIRLVSIVSTRNQLGISLSVAKRANDVLLEALKFLHVIKRNLFSAPILKNLTYSPINFNVFCYFPHAHCWSHQIQLFILRSSSLVLKCQSWRSYFWKHSLDFCLEENFRETNSVRYFRLRFSAQTINVEILLHLCEFFARAHSMKGRIENIRQESHEDQKNLSNWYTRKKKIGIRLDLKTTFVINFLDSNGWRHKKRHS